MRKLVSGLDVAYHAVYVGQNFNRGDFRGKDFRGMNFTNSSFRGADFSYADLRGCKFVKADLSRSNLHMANCAGADFSSADMTMMYAKATIFNYARMWGAALKRGTYKNTFFLGTDMSYSDWVGSEFLGARFGVEGKPEYDAIVTGVRNWDRAVFFWWLSPFGGKPSYDPKPGWTKLDRSILGGVTIQENIGRDE